MQITKVSFPQPDVCCVQVQEPAQSYQAHIQAFYEKNKQFYPVLGCSPETVTRELIEQRYGAQAFRLDVINHLLVYEYPALQAGLCEERGLTALTEAEPHLIHEDDDGFVLECTFALVPRLEMTGYTGQTLPADPQLGVKLLLARAADRSGVTLSERAVRTEAESRLEALQDKLRDAKTSMADFLRQAGKTEQELWADLCLTAQQDLAQRVALYNIARQEGLLTTPQQLEEEICRMEAISPQNSYVRTNPTAQRSVSTRLTNQRTLEWLRAHNQFEE